MTGLIKSWLERIGHERERMKEGERESPWHKPRNEKVTYIYNSRIEPRVT